MRNRIVYNRVVYKGTHAHSRSHTGTQWDILWRPWVSERLLVVRLFPSSWHEPPVTQGDLSTGSQSEQQCQKSTESCEKKTQLVLESISQHRRPTESERPCIYFCFEKPHVCPKLTLITYFQHKTFVTQLTSADVLKGSSGAGEPWQVVLSLDSGVHLQPVGQESCGSLMIFDIRTSRCSEDMNKTYGPSDHRPEAFRVSNEIWGVISIRKEKEKNPFVR